METERMHSNSKTERWYEEHVQEEWYHKFKIIGEFSVKKQSEFQTIEFLDLSGTGRTLILDGMIQSCEKDEFIYHEMLVHPALIYHPNPNRVFIGGGGEGGTAREVLKHKSVTFVQMVDIDEECVELCKKHIPKTNNGAFEDERMEVKFDDAMKQLERSKTGEFDVIILDLPDPQEGGPCYYLYTREFYELCRSKLSENGILVTQSTEADIVEDKTNVFSKICKTLQEAFPIVHPYTIHIPSFAHNWGFNIACKNPKTKKLNDPRIIDRMIRERIFGGEENLRCFSGECHCRTFMMKKYVRQALEKETVIITKDKNVFYK